VSATDPPPRSAAPSSIRWECRPEHRDDKNATRQDSSASRCAEIAGCGPYALLSRKGTLATGPRRPRHPRAWRCGPRTRAARRVVEERERSRQSRIRRTASSIPYSRAGCRSSSNGRHRKPTSRRRRRHAPRSRRAPGLQARRSKIGHQPAKTAAPGASRSRSASVGSCWSFKGASVSAAPPATARKKRSWLVFGSSLSRTERLMLPRDQGQRPRAQ
jgi:hypothetical protein